MQRRSMNLGWMLVLVFLFAQAGVRAADETAIAAEKKNSATAWLSGFEKSMQGAPFPYHSILPDARTALLVRCNEANRSAAWETQVVPEDFSEPFVQFVWIFGIDANVEQHPFTLHVNDQPYISFSNPRESKVETWEVHGSDGATLTFKPTMKDRYNDLMGFAFLTLPIEAVKKGEPVKLCVTGDDTDSPVWYMTFEHAVSEWIRIESTAALLKIDGKARQEVEVDLLHLGERTRVEIEVPGQEARSFPLDFGPNRYSFFFPPVKTVESRSLRIRIDGKEAMEKTFSIAPVRPWTIYLVQHSHTDIGYTRPQTEILPEHLRYIDYALDFCDATDDYPDNAKFRWTCESSWAVREYLKRRPDSQIQRLKQRVREGRIALTAMIFNLSELVDEPGFHAFLNPLKRFRAHGLPVRTAMQNDVNGMPWCLADYLPQLGVRYFVMGQHNHRALTCFKRPTAFWWESPAGSRMLGFRADHYMTGNRWGLHTGNLDLLKKQVLQYLKDLEASGYPFDSIEVQYSGYLTDNSPPSLSGPEMVKAWNETFASPQLRSATIDEFMDYVAANHADALPVYRAAWPDWWTDGAGSAAREMAAARRTHSDLIASQGLLAKATVFDGKAPDGCLDELQEVYDPLLFYDEHTYGAAESISDPGCENSRVQWGEKSAYAWEAVKKTRMLREKALGFLHPHLPRHDVPSLTVFNTLGWTRSGLHEVYIDHQILDIEKAFAIVDASGKAIPAQRISSRSDGSYWALWLSDIPAMGMATFRIIPQEEVSVKESPQTGTVLENEFYRLEVDEKTGTIRHLIDKSLGRDIVDPDADWRFLSFIYETLSNRQQLEQYRLDSFDRKALESVRVEEGTNGALWKSLIIRGSSPGCAEDGSIRCEIRLHHHAKRIDFTFSMRKNEVFDPEGVYVAFPFRLPDAELFYEAQGGVVSPGKNQMPGSSSDWHTVQNFACLRNSEAQVVWVCDEAPLVHFGDINLGRFQYVSVPEKPHIYSWIMNNYWTTNFRASQSGEFKWNYQITSSKDAFDSTATRFGWDCRVPFVSRVLPAGKTVSDLTASSPLTQSLPPNLLLVCTKPCAHGKGIVFQIRELDNQATEIDAFEYFDGKRFYTFREVNVLGEPLKQLARKISFDGLEVKFIEALF